MATVTQENSTNQTATAFFRTWQQLHRRPPPTKQLQPSSGLGNSYTGELHQPNSYSLLQVLATVTQENSANQTATAFFRTWQQLHRRTPPTKQLQPSSGLGNSYTGELHQPNSYSLLQDLSTVPQENSTNQTATAFFRTWQQLHRRTPPTKQLQSSSGLGNSYTGELHQPNSYSLLQDLATVAQENSTNQTATAFFRTWQQLHRRTPPTKQLQPSSGLGNSCKGELHQPNSYSLLQDLTTVAQENFTNQTATTFFRTWQQLHRRTPPTKQLQPSSGLGNSCKGELHQPNSYSLLQDLATVAQENSTNQTATVSFGIGNSFQGEGSSQMK